MRIVVAIGLFVALCTAALAQEAPPQAPPKLEDTPAAQSFMLFSGIYQAAVDAKDLAAFEKEVIGLPVVWLGVIKDVPVTGEHLVIVPLVSAAKENFEVFAVVRLGDGTKLADIAKPGQKIILDGVITSGGTSGPIVTVKRFALQVVKENDK